jgi:sulfate adenylyltransferase subunit 2
MTPSPVLSLQQLNERRRRAVEMRLAGSTLPAIRTATGLSAPTVISAYKAFLQSGWQGIATAARGRVNGQGRALDATQEALLQAMLLRDLPEAHGGEHGLWTTAAASQAVQTRFGLKIGASAMQRTLQRAGLDFEAFAKATAKAAAPPAPPATTAAPGGAALPQFALGGVPHQQRQDAKATVWCGQATLQHGARALRLMLAQTRSAGLAWLPFANGHCVDEYLDFLTRLRSTLPEAVQILLHGVDTDHPALRAWHQQHPAVTLHTCPVAQRGRQAETDHHATAQDGPAKPNPMTQRPTPARPAAMILTHLQRLEAESIHILREVVAECAKPVMLYSVGKDSATMLHLAKKAFYPAPPPFPLLHVDTTWKFRDMYALRDRMASESGMQLLVHHNPEAQAMGINPFSHGAQIHTDLWKTQGLKQALDQHGFDAAFGGARRDEEKSRAKERIFSFRSSQHRWDPKQQRPELWQLYNARKQPGESIRVFPLSNWTELDIWQYIHLEAIPVVPLYLAAERPVVERNGMLIMVDDARMPLLPGELPVMRKVRFRTLGCYPLTGAIESDADTLPAVIREMLLARTSERQGRMIDHDASASMEKKKQEGYF